MKWEYDINLLLKYFSDNELIIGNWYDYTDIKERNLRPVYWWRENQIVIVWKNLSIDTDCVSLEILKTLLKKGFKTLKSWDEIYI